MGFNWWKTLKTQWENNEKNWLFVALVKNLQNLAKKMGKKTWYWLKVGTRLLEALD